MEAKRKSLYITVAVVVAVLMVGSLAMLSGRPQPTAAPTERATTAAGPEPEPAAEVHTEAAADPGFDEFLLSLPRRDPADPAAIGDVDAPVVMIEWADFRCPFCSVFAEDTLPQLQHYFDDGLVRFEFRDLAIFGDESVYAAVAARAAGEQNLHHEFMRELYAATPNEGHPDVDEAVVVGVAESIGVPDLGRFVADLDSPELQLQVLLDSREASELGLSSVPAFVVGTQVIQGAQPLAYFEQVIEQELAKAGAR